MKAWKKISFLTISFLLAVEYQAIAENKRGPSNKDYPMRIFNEALYSGKFGSCVRFLSLNEDYAKAYQLAKEFKRKIAYQELDPTAKNCALGKSMADNLERVYDTALGPIAAACADEIRDNTEDLRMSQNLSIFDSFKGLIKEENGDIVRALRTACE